MTPLESALVVLVLIWSLIFIIIAFALIIILIQVRRGLEKINKILDNAENVAENVSGPLKTVSSVVANFLKKKKRSS